MATVRKRKWTHGGQERTAWIADYFDQSGKRRQKTFNTKKAARNWLEDARQEIKAGRHTADSVSVTVYQAGLRWLEQCERDGLERSTIKQRAEHLNLHIAGPDVGIGGVKLSQLTAPAVKDWTGRLRDGGRSRAMVQKALTSLKTMISEAQASGLVAQNVAREVRLKANGRHKREVAIPTKDDLRAMLAQDSGRWRPLIVTAIFTGMRASELRGLTWEHVDFDKGVIRVRQRADRWGTMGPLKSKAARRDIPLAPTVVNTLKEWKLACPSSSLDLVFPNGHGNVESNANIRNRGFIPLLRACGIVDGDGKPHYTFHALRHAAASLFIEQGWAPKRVQAILGHASVTMTLDVYGHLFPDPEGDQDAMAQVEAQLLG